SRDLFYLVVLSTSHHPPRSTLFPYTTLFRSHLRGHLGVGDPGLLPEPGQGRDALHMREELRAHLGVVVVEVVVLVGQGDSGLDRSEEHTSELQSRFDLVCRLLLEKKTLQKAD